MKFNVNGYSQKKLIENKLDLTDSLILRALADMYVSEKMEYKIIKNNKYMWCSYAYLLEQIPIIGTSRTLVRKIDNLIEKGILKKEVITSRKGKLGKFLYLSFGEKYAELTEYQPNDKMSSDTKDHMTKCHQPNDKMSSDQMTKCHIKDYSINNYSINNKYKENIKRKIFEELDKENLDDTLREKIKEWVEYRSMIKKPLKTYRPIKLILKSNWIQKSNAIDFIDWCMNHEWQGLEDKFYDSYCKEVPPKTEYKTGVDYAKEVEEFYANNQ